MNTETKGRAIVEFEKIILNINEVAFNEGEKQGRKNQCEEFEQSMEIELEKSNTRFVAEKFADCKTLADFTTVFNEIRNRSFNFMT